LDTTHHKKNDEEMQWKERVAVVAQTKVKHNSNVKHLEISNKI
jgi:hypothetical protein